MSKRFIDTRIFDDDWFMDLSKDSKLLWLYFITKCDHAGMIKLNMKLCKLQTDIKDLDENIIQLGNRIITVSEHLYFIPKFIEFQYPGFPNSKAKAQISAIEILKKYNLLNEEDLTVIEQLPNSYNNNNNNGYNNDNGKSKKAEFDFSFVASSYLEIFEDWIKYKKSINDSYKTQQTLEACYHNLIDLSGNDPMKAKSIVQYSVGNKYKGLFPLKQTDRSKQTSSVFDKYLIKDGK